MERTIDIDIDQQIVCEPAEALAEDDEPPVVRFDGAEGEGHLFAGRTEGGFPSEVVFDDRRPTGLSEPEAKESLVYLVGGWVLALWGAGLTGDSGANTEAEASASAL